ncbi:hypothetical protein SMKC032_43200 [Serratia marcescens]|nr:hypothetical protein SMKC032_43200 [Serratia marcescens]
MFSPPVDSTSITRMKVSTHAYKVRTKDITYQIVLVFACSPEPVIFVILKSFFTSTPISPSKFAVFLAIMFFSEVWLLVIITLLSLLLFAFSLSIISLLASSAVLIMRRPQENLFLILHWIYWQKLKKFNSGFREFCNTNPHEIFSFIIVIDGEKVAAKTVCQHFIYFMYSEVDFFL